MNKKEYYSIETKIINHAFEISNDKKYNSISDEWEFKDTVEAQGFNVEAMINEYHFNAFVNGKIPDFNDIEKMTYDIALKILEADRKYYEEYKKTDKGKDTQYATDVYICKKMAKDILRSQKTLTVKQTKIIDLAEKRAKAFEKKHNIKRPELPVNMSTLRRNKV